MNKEKRKFKEWTQQYNNRQLNLILGEIDDETIFQDTLESLYYVFPLIEKIIRTIGSNYDIEWYSQGKMRTVNSIVKNNPNLFKDETKTLIKKYFDDNGLRNTILHPSKKSQVQLNLSEVRRLLFLLMDQLLNELSAQTIEDIELF